ncbi:MAG: preprotein translocase subunit SecG [Alphaproteobacteria bacterium]|nr:preprotein translocase subunit SecG [Alphaproteobacteria bacterium]
MINILLVLNIIVVVLLIGIILLQKSQGGVLGMGGSGSKNGIFTARSAGNLITKLTYIFGAMFFLICILLAFLVSRHEGSRSFVETMAEKNGVVVKEISAPAVNKIPEDKVKEELKKEAIKHEAAKKKPTAPTTK